MDGREKERSYYRSIQKSGIIVRRRTFVSVIRVILISSNAINLDCKRAFIGATNYHHYLARVITELAKRNY